MFFGEFPTDGVGINQSSVSGVGNTSEASSATVVVKVFGLKASPDGRPT